MAKYGKKHGATGILNTHWGDYGHIELLANSIPGMIFGAGLGWNAEQAYLLEDAYKWISLQEFGDFTGKLGELLIDLGRIDISWMFFSIWSCNRAYNTIYFAQLEDWTISMREEYIHKTDEARIWSDYIKASKIEKELLSLSKSILPQRKTDMDEFIASARAFMLFTSLKLIIKKYDSTFKVNISKLIHMPMELVEQFELWFSRYERLWMPRNKESELYKLRDSIFDICDTLRDYALLPE